MKRLVLFLGLILVLGAAVAVPVSAAKAPRFTATLTHDGDCGFTVTAGWSGVKVGSVIGQWIVDGEVVSGAFTNTGKGRTVTMAVGPGTPAPDSHTWSALVQFYSGPGLSGALIGLAESNEVTANCVLSVNPI